jgi:hypothetical protein
MVLLQLLTAVYVMVRVTTQPLVTSTLAQVIDPAQSAPTAGLQPGIVTGLQPRFTLAGQLVNTGGAPESITSIVWTHVTMLVQASVAVHVRVSVWLVGQVPAATTSLKVSTGRQPPVTVGTPVKFVSVWPHCAAMYGGQVITGGAGSTFHVITFVQVALLQPTAVQVSVRVTTQPSVVSTAAQVTVAGTQPFVATAVKLAQVGIVAGLHPKSTVAEGQVVNTGGLVFSSQVMTWPQMFVLWQASTAV